MADIIEKKARNDEEYILILRALKDPIIREHFQFYKVIRENFGNLSVYHAETYEGAVTLCLEDYQMIIAGKPKAREIINKKLEDIVKKSISK